MSLETILESYINGQIKQAKAELAESDHTFSQLFNFYVETQLSEEWDILENLKLFVYRMAGK